ncbi:putative salivary secreted peptide [Lycorma delicatula]|uniref:putative salivary secreted peptide n=1 Tax=Lycorma delicatula TaxID=130591 RepID=UPI003F50EC8E
MFFYRMDYSKVQIEWNMIRRILFFVAISIVLVESSNYGFKPEIYPQNYVPVPVHNSQNYGFKQEIYQENYRENLSHNLIVGTLIFGDKLLYYDVINIPRKLFRTVDYNVTYPNHGSSNTTINYIRVINLKVDGTGGFPRLIKGGIGYHNVTIQLTSKLNHGLHFNINIYGK